MFSMPTSVHAGPVTFRLRCMLWLALAGLGTASSAAAQSTPIRFEVNFSGAYRSYDAATRLKSGLGLGGRAGIWLPYNIGAEVEGIFSSPQTTGGLNWTVRTIAGALLYRFPVGAKSSLYLKAGYGGAKYHGDACDLGVSVPGTGPCGTTGTVIGGAGVNIGLSPTLLIRAEGQLQHSTSPSFNNVLGTVGVSILLGSKPPVDSDHDGVYDRNDRCPGTAAGIRVDTHGCPADSDQDGVPDHLDKCSNTPVGAQVDATGCPVDDDRDGVANGLDTCPNTPAGALVNASGCPSDSDKDGVLDGVDRCPETPAGATVDALGCPGDEDGDGVLDGIDRCPRTPAGVRVDEHGCAAEERSPAAAAPPDSGTSGTAPTAQPSSAAPAVLRGVVFRTGSAELSARSRPVLDSLAEALRTQPRLLVEIAGFTDNTGDSTFNQHLSQLRAEAVRSYLISAGVPPQRVIARGYGPTEPVAPNDTPLGRSLNRRIEVRPITPGH